MAFLKAPRWALAWLGGQGTRALVASVAVGIALPPLGAFFKPWLAETVFLLLAIAFLRIEPAAVRRHLRRPLLVIAAVLWTMVAIPLLSGLACILVGADAAAPDLFLGMMLHAVGSPMMAAPAFAALMGLDATLVLMMLVFGTAVVPLTAPFFAWFFFGDGLQLSPADLGIKLSVMLFGSAAVGLGLRRIVGAAAIARYGDEIDGINILALFVFVAAVMSNVLGGFLDDPLLVLGVLALGFAVFGVLLVASALVFWRAGRERALAVAFATSQRNMGLMFAAAGAGLPDLAWLYLALGQFPIYLSPQFLKPLTRKLLGIGATRPSPFC